MPKPKNKSELLEQSKGNFKQLIDYLKTLSQDEKELPFSNPGLNKNIRDVIAHIHHWNTMTLRWHKEGMKGNQPDMPAKGYTWQTLPLLNEEINNLYHDTSYKEALSLFKNSYKEIATVIDVYSNEELFKKKRYPWTGSTSMGAYLTSASSSHYAWALKLIKKKRQKS